MGETPPAICPNTGQACGYYGRIINQRSLLESSPDIDDVDEVKLEIVNEKIEGVSSGNCSNQCHVVGEMVLDAIEFEAETRLLIKGVRDFNESMGLFSSIKKIIKRK